MEDENTIEDLDIPIYGVYDKNGILIDSNNTPENLMHNLTVKQFKLMLRRISVTREEIIEAMRQSITDNDAFEDAVIEYDFSTQFERNHPLVRLVSARLGFTEDQMDSMWKHAMTL